MTSRILTFAAMLLAPLAVAFPVTAASLEHRASAESSLGGITVDSLGSSALVLRLGVVGSYWQPDSPANVSVYADGRVVVVDPDEALGYVTFVLDPGSLDELLDLAGAAQPFDDLDYGEVEVSDVGSTRVEVHADQGDAVISVWALDFLDGLSAEQRANREQLLTLAAALDELAADTGAHVEPVAPYVSDAVTVVLRPVLPGMEPDGTSAPWPLESPPADLHGDGFHVVCFAAPNSVVEGLPDEIDGEHLWRLPDDLDVATPSVVAAAITAVLPDAKTCEEYAPVEQPRTLTDAELAAPPHDWTSPWPQGERTTSHPFEEWMAVDAMARTVLPERLGGDWDWNRWSWFDYRFAAGEVGGLRVIDFQATCTSYVEDEEPACTIDARFDAATGELLEFSAA